MFVATRSSLKNMLWVRGTGTKTCANRKQLLFLVAARHLTYCTHVTTNSKLKSLVNCETCEVLTY